MTDKRKLGEIATFIDYRGKTPNKTTSGIPLITAKIVKNGTIDTPTEFIAQNDYQRWMTRGYPEVGDVVLTTEAPLGEVAQIRDKHVALAQRIITLRGNPSVLNNKYLKYFLQSNKGQALLRAKETGTTVVGIKAAELKEIEIDLPSIDIQKRIATILSSLDDKIELNNRINKNLEEQLFAYFDEIILRKSENNIQGRLADIIDLNPTRSLKKGSLARFIEMSNLSTQGSFPSAWDYKEYNGGIKFKNGDTLIARITPCLENGKTAYIDFLDPSEVAFGSTEYIVLASKKGICCEICYCYARNKDFREYAIKNMNGSSGRQRVSAETIGNYEIHLPQEADLQKFATVAKPIMEMIRKNALANRTLQQLRDTLLPKLMSGEIDVSTVAV